VKLCAFVDVNRTPMKASWLLVLLITSLIALPALAVADMHATGEHKQATSEHFSRVKMLTLEESNGDSNNSLNLAQSGNINSTSAILFVHGSPGDWHAFSDYLQDDDLAQDNLVLSYDRPGWGQSTLGYDLLGQFEYQARAALTIMQHYPDKHWTIVGHSLGASIAPTIMLNAIRAGYSVNAIVLLAGSLEPKLGKPRWFNRFAKFSLVNMLLGDDLRNSNIEILRLHNELMRQDERLKETSVTTRLILVQGARDKLVSPKNAAYVRTAWANTFGQLTIEVIEDEGHFLPWRQAPRIKKHILESLSP